MTYNLIKATDQFMTRKRISLPRKPAWYPSEASVSWVDSNGETQIRGTCMRAAYFRYTGIFSEHRKPHDAYTMWIFALGKAVEEILVEQYKQMGIWVDNNVKFYDPERNISGEVDIFLEDPETKKLIVTECKSFFGYYALM